jgi:CRISPR-associated protein Cas1
VASGLEALRWLKLYTLLVYERDAPASGGQASYIIQAITKEIIGHHRASAPPDVVFHIAGTRHTARWRKGDFLPVEFMFPQWGSDDVRRWREYLSLVMASKGKSAAFSLAEANEPVTRSLTNLAEEQPDLPIEGEICLEFLSPLPFSPAKGKPRTFISREQFINALERRLSRLFGATLSYASDRDEFDVLPYYWNYTESRYQSHSQPGSTHYLNGCIGKLYIRGRFADFLPFILLGSELHAGTKIGYSQGYYLIHPKSTLFFTRTFPDKTALATVVRDMANRYDYSTTADEWERPRDYDEATLTDEIWSQLKENNYQPEPNRAFLIPKKDGSSRLVERLKPKDFIVQRYLLSMLSPVVEKILEDESIGFRKATSRTRAIELVRAAVAEGYAFAVESDIESFFPSINLETLECLLDHYLPSNDMVVKDLLVRCIRVPYILQGKAHERHKGLAQGSPLSPLLANLYLDSFDEEIKSSDMRLIRFADDFVILARTREEAEDVLADARSILSTLGLGLKETKTAIKPVSEGFRFLGIEFQGLESRVLPEETPRILAKPLYITEPFVFLALDGEAVAIRKQGKVIDTIPLRRVSEVLVMERASFSTSFVRRCVELKIPLTVTLSSGYYLTTIKPDSKAYFDIVYQHTKRFAELSDAEHVTIAREIATGKLANYVAMFQQRYQRGQHVFTKELQEFIARINCAEDIYHILGFEGAAAAKCYEYLNNFIDDPSFHIRKRIRKKPDPINSMLNAGYYLLFSRINALCRTAGLNPYLGFLHSHADDYESLVVDIQELFRSRIDRFVIKLLNLKIIQQNDFQNTDRGMYLTSQAFRRLLGEFEKELSRVPHSNKATLMESLERQVMSIKKWVRDGSPIMFYRWDDER